MRPRPGGCRRRRRLDRAVALAADLELDPLRAAVVHRDHVLAAGLGPAQRPAGRCGRASRPARPRPPAPCRRSRRRRPARRRAPARLQSRASRRARRGPGAGVWVDSHTVSRPSVDRRAAVERGSIGHAASRWLIDGAARRRRRSESNRFVVGARAGWCEADVGADVLDTAATSSPTASVMSVTAGQRLVVDQHELGGVDSPRARLGQHDGDDVADEPDLVARPETAGTSARRSRGTAAAGYTVEVDVGRGEHLDAGQRRGLRDVDVGDLRVRPRRAHERDVQRVRRARGRRRTVPRPVRKRGSSRRRTRCPITFAKARRAYRRTDYQPDRQQHQREPHRRQRSLERGRQPLAD